MRSMMLASFLTIVGFCCVNCSPIVSMLERVDTAINHPTTHPSTRPALGEGSALDNILVATNETSSIIGRSNIPMIEQIFGTIAGLSGSLIFLERFLGKKIERKPSKNGHVGDNLS